MNFESESGQKQEQEELETRWRGISIEVEQIRDKLGLGIDKEIKPAVVALKAHDLGTTGSCEGHVDHGTAYPWIDVESVFAEKLLSDERYQSLKEKVRAQTRKENSISPEEIQEHQALVQMQIEENDRAYEQLQGLLAEFYEAHPDISVTERAQLVIDKGPWKQSRLQRRGGVPRGQSIEKVQESWSLEEKASNLMIYRKELERFTEFLKRKFFHQLPEETD